MGKKPLKNGNLHKKPGDNTAESLESEKNRNMATKSGGKIEKID